MRKILLIAVLFASIQSKAQNINYRRKFFSLQETKFSLGVGLEYAFSPAVAIPLAKPPGLKVLQKDPRGLDSAAYLSYGMYFDFYSENSIVGIVFGAQLDYNSIGFKDENNNIADYSKITRISLPAYLKFRFGKILRSDGRDRPHFLIMLGGSYDIPVKIDRQTFDLSYNNILKEDKSIGQLKSIIAASAIIGYETYLEKSQSVRASFYLKGSYDLSNQFNSEYVDYKNGGTSTLSNYPEFDIRQLNLTLGMKLFLNFKKPALANN